MAGEDLFWRGDGITHIAMNNHNDSAYEAMFDDLIRDTFGFSFAPWLARRLWDARYESYSVIENGHMLANICVFKADITLRGRQRRAHQLGGVATRGAERGKGLSRLLMEHILNKYPETPAFLFANPSVLDFYPRFGFRPAPDYRPFLLAEIDNADLRPIKLDAEHPRLEAALRERGAYSSILDCLNTYSIQVFHLLLDYPEGIYHLPKSDVVLVAEQKGDCLFIADVIAKAPVAFERIRAELPFSGIRRVEFGFCPDWMGVSPDWQMANAREDPFFLRGEWDLPSEYCFPTMSKT